MGVRPQRALFAILWNGRMMSCGSSYSLSCARLRIPASQQSTQFRNGSPRLRKRTVTTPATKSAGVIASAAARFRLGRENWVERLQHRDGNAGAIQIGNEVGQHGPDLTVVTTSVVP
jgi:hypothetical protein